MSDARNREMRNQWGEREPRVLATGNPAEVKAASAARTRRSFLLGAAAAAGGYGAWHWIDSSPAVGQLQAVLRRSLLVNARLAQALFGERGMAPEYPLSRAVELRLNGVVGLEKDLAPDGWRLQVAGVENAKASPHYVADVTAWEYKYLGETKTTPQLNDVKSAPGNVGDNGKVAAPPKEQKSKGTGSAEKPSPNAPPPTAPAGDGKPASNGATATPDARHTGPEASPEQKAAAPADDIAARFNRMTQQLTHKRHLTNSLAGESASSLDIGTPGLLLNLADLAALPKVELVTEFKCVEGWSQITQWSGYRLRDFIEAYPPARVSGREPSFVYMETPDSSYYAGYSMQAARHPQSLLVTEMSGKLLNTLHGAPLRLHMPIKYGYKQLKRIGLISYTDTKPDDYWAKLGYDWYAGL